MEGHHIMGSNGWRKGELESVECEEGVTGCRSYPFKDEKAWTDPTGER